MDMDKKAWNMEVENLWRPQMSMKIWGNERATSLSYLDERFFHRDKNGGLFKFQQKTMEKSKLKVWQ